MPAKSAPLRALGQAIRATRVKRGYSQEGLARYAGIDRSYFVAIERGEFNITIETLLRVAVVLDVAAPELFARSFADKSSPIVTHAAAEPKDGNA